MAANVSGKALGLHLEVVRKHGLDDATFFRGTRVNPAAIPEWVGWADFALLTRRLGEACGGAEAITLLGESLIKTESLKRIVHALQLGVSPRALYWANVKWGGPSLFPLMDNDFHVLDDGRFCVKVTIPQGQDDCPEFFHLNLGLFRTLPGIIGLQRAVVELVLTPNQGTYYIVPPPSVTVLARIARMARMVVAAGLGVDSPTLVTFGYLVAQQDNLRLQNHAVEVARALAEEQRHIAEAALEVKSQFLATMSHELRTPLNGVMGMAELLAQTALTPVQREYAGTIRASGENLLSIINDILDYSKIEAGRLEIDSTEFSLRDVVSDVLDLFAGRAHSRDLELLAAFDADVPTWLRGGARPVRQIVANLVNNAIKFTDSGEIEVRVAMLPADGLHANVRISVRDTGPGIANVDFGRLFEPFTQLDSSSTRRHGGTGLGLAISRRLARQLGGNVTVESVVGHGSTFRADVHLTPLAWAAAALAHQPGQPPPRALIIDDNIPFCAALADDLARLGVEVDAIGDAAAGLPALLAADAEGRPYALAFVELTPGGAVANLVNALQRDERFAGLIVVLVAGPSVAPGTGALETMDNVYTLRKPVRADRLPALLAMVGRPEMGHVREPAPAPDWSLPPISPEVRGRVLVVEDNELNHRVAVGMLNYLGFATDIAEDGRQALAVLAEQRYDVVLMDCQMPNMDGFEATRLWRAREAEGQRVPIVAMTAFAGPEDRQRCHAAGMDDFLTKPVRLDGLEETLRRWLEERPLGVAAQPQPAPTVVTPPGPGPDADRAVAVRLDELRRFIDPAQIVLLIDAFKRESAADLAALVKAFAVGDATQLGRSAHRLKGSCRNVGAAGAAALCQTLMGHAHAGDLTAAALLMPALTAQVSHTCEILCGLDG